MSSRSKEGVYPEWVEAGSLVENHWNDISPPSRDHPRVPLQQRFKLPLFRAQIKSPEVFCHPGFKLATATCHQLGS